MNFTTNKKVTMRTRNYSILLKLVAVILCFHFLQSCEKDDVNPVYPTTLRSGSGAHLASGARWQPCIPSTSYQLLDPAFNPKPVGYTETGQVIVSAAMDSIQ